MYIAIRSLHTCAQAQYVQPDTTTVPPQEELFIWPPVWLFFNSTDVSCAKKRVRHACTCPTMVTPSFEKLKLSQITPPLKIDFVLVPQRWPMAEQWKKLWRLSTLTLKTGTSLLLIAKSGTQWSNDDSSGAVLEDNVSHTHGIYPCSPSLFVLSLFPFSFWWVVEPMLPGRSWYKLTYVGSSRAPLASPQWAFSFCQFPLTCGVQW